jgi:hypothetical protein
MMKETLHDDVVMLLAVILYTCTLGCSQQSTPEVSNQHAKIDKRTIKVQATVKATSVASESQLDGWGEPNNGLRCKIAPSSFDIVAGQRLDFFLYVQNVSDSIITVTNRMGPLTYFYLNGKFTGQETSLYDRFYFTRPPSMSSYYITIKPGEILSAALPVGRLDTFSYGAIGDGGVCAVPIHSTGNLGTYRVYTIYDEHRTRSQKSWWKGSMRSPEILINVRFERPFELDLNIPVNFRAHTGTERTAFRVDSIRFIKTGQMLNATLKTVIFPDPNTVWRTKVQLIDGEDKVIAQARTITKNDGRNWVERKLPLSLGRWSRLSRVERFCITVDNGVD